MCYQTCSPKDLLGFKEMLGDYVYIGNQLVLGRNKNKDFKSLKDIVGRKLEGWNHHLLSKVGKITLIKSVLHAIKWMFPTFDKVVIL